MRRILAGILVAGLHLPAWSQQPPSPSAQLEALKNARRQLDSLINSAKSKAAATASIAPGPGRAHLRPDSLAWMLPPRNDGALAALPPRPPSVAEIRNYANALDRRLAPALKNAFGTTVPNTDPYAVTTLDNAAAMGATMGILDQAVLIALKAVERDPGNPVALNNAGALLHEGGLNVAAISMLETAATVDSGNSTLENNLGQSYLSLGDRESASRHLQASLASAPYHPLANSSMALISLDKGDRASALKYAENSLRGGFTTKAYDILLRLKKDAVLMDYFKDRYRQPEYFNEKKYPLPEQCEKATDIPAMKAKYQLYLNTLEKAQRKYSSIARYEGQLGVEETMKKLHSLKPGDGINLYISPFMALATAMELDITKRMQNDAADILAKAKYKYDETIQDLLHEYNRKVNPQAECSEQIDLSGVYMEKMAEATREYQKACLRIYEDFYEDQAYWSFFTTDNQHSRRAKFCQWTAAFLQNLHDLAVTHFLDVPYSCVAPGKEQKDSGDMEVEGKCPLGEDGVELPFVIGKYNLSCDETEFEFGEVIIGNIKHKFATGETLIAIGIGAKVSLIGHGEEAKVDIPALGPFRPGLEAGAKEQLYLVFNNGSLTDGGLRYIAELDVLGWGREMSSGYTMGANSGFELAPGMLKNFLDDKFGPQEAPQVNPHVKPYH